MEKQRYYEVTFGNGCNMTCRADNKTEAADHASKVGHDVGITAAIAHVKFIGNAEPVNCGEIYNDDGSKYIDTSKLVGNARFCVAQFEKVFGVFPETYKAKVGIYILNPGDCFQGFGGSSSGLVVRKTASLIVRQESVQGCEDTEYNVNDQKVWARIFNWKRTES